MRISKTISITLPPDMHARAIKLAKQENRTMSELVREALRRYNFEDTFYALQDYGRAQAKKTGVREEEVVDIVKSIRKKLWPEYKKKHGMNKKSKKK